MLTRDLVRWGVSPVVLPRGVTPDPDEMEWFFLLAKYYRSRFPPELVSDDELHTLTAPTLVLKGEHEHCFDIPVAIARAQTLPPDVRAAEIVPGVEHAMVTDNPALINGRLMQFLRHTR